MNTWDFIGIVLAALMLGYLAGAASTRAAARSAYNPEANLLDFMYAMGYSLQCVGDMWAVTCGKKVIGTPADSPVAAMESAIDTQFPDPSGAGNV